jgi:hypothetical protein
MIKVVHCKKEDFDIYIGRKFSGMHFGNPFSFGGKSKIAKLDFPTRKECIDAFRKWMMGTDYQDIEPERRKWILANISILRDKKIGCFCSPERCHGDVYVELLDLLLPTVLTSLVEKCRNEQV